MHTDEDGKRYYSHTSLTLFRLCPRRWYRRYVRGIAEGTSDAAAAGTWLCERPVTGLITQDGIYSNHHEVYWANFLAEFGGDDSYQSALYTPELPRNVLKLYKASPIQGKVVEIQKRYVYDLTGGFLYQSIPDFVVWRSRPEMVESSTVALDCKLRSYWGKYPDAPPEVEPLLPYDDQGLGQAIAAGADTFGQMRFYVNKRTGELHGPVYVEEPVSSILREEWIQNQVDTIEQIERYLKRTHASWPIDQNGCKAFGRECPGLEECKLGWIRKESI